MLKGQLTDFETMLTVTFAIVGLFLMWVFFYGNLGEIIVEVGPSFDRLTAIDAAHKAGSCLGGNVVDAQLLGSVGNDLCSIEACSSLCVLNTGAQIEDLTTGQVWDFGYQSDSDLTHQIFVRIQEGDEIHVGKLFISRET